MYIEEFKKYLNRVDVEHTKNTGMYLPVPVWENIVMKLFIELDFIKLRIIEFELEGSSRFYGSDQKGCTVARRL